MHEQITINPVTKTMPNLIVTGRETGFSMLRKKDNNWQLRDNTATDVEGVLIEMPDPPTSQTVDVVIEVYLIARNKGFKDGFESHKMQVART